MAFDLYCLFAGNGTDTRDGGKQVNRKPIMMILIGYCLLALMFSLLGVAITPQAALAEGTGQPDPPIPPPSDSTITASNPGDVMPGVADAKREAEKDYSFFETVEIMVRVIF